MSIWPPIIVLILEGLTLVTHISLHGKSRVPYNGPLQFVGTVITLGLLYWGGFFKPLTQ